MSITAQNVAIICPTKNRPDKVMRLFNSITQLYQRPYQVIIADGGHNLKPTVNALSNELNLICLYCPKAGQILQRNYAHKYLHKNIQLVLHLDDDITLDRDALTKLIRSGMKKSQKMLNLLPGIVKRKGCADTSIIGDAKPVIFAN